VNVRSYDDGSFSPSGKGLSLGGSRTAVTLVHFGVNAMGTGHRECQTGSSPLGDPAADLQIFTSTEFDKRAA